MGAAATALSRDLAAAPPEERRARPPKIVLTGGPGGGKTTAADMIARELGTRVAWIRETATILFSGGFPRDGDDAVRRACQRAIFATQKELEASHEARYPERILLCDRGTVDGAAYWPEGPESFFASLGTTPEAERGRYDAVLFFESAAVGGIEVDGKTNPHRVETTDEAARLDAALRALWAPHPRFRLVRHSCSFLAKVVEAIGAFQDLLREIAPP